MYAVQRLVGTLHHKLEGPGSIPDGFTGIFYLLTLPAALWPWGPYKGLGRPLGLQDIEAPRISRHSAHEGGTVISPTH